MKENTPISSKIHQFPFPHFTTPGKNKQKIHQENFFKFLVWKSSKDPHFALFSPLQRKRKRYK